MSDLAELAATLDAVVAGGDGGAPQRICEVCVAALPVSGAAVSMMTDADHRVMVCATDETSAHLEELQFSLGEGPCVEGFAARRPVLVPDLGEVSDARWPIFAAAARRTQARAVYVFPLQFGAIGLGVLDLYRVDPGFLGADELTGALLTADAVLWALLNHRSALSPDGRSEFGGSAVGWLDHTEVHQATGMIMAQSEVSAEDALARLRAFAFAHDRSIEEVAREVVARRLHFDIACD
ncbi:MAG: ANTAR domain-containing protein [Pseudonocardiaceae bacterium]